MEHLRLDCIRIRDAEQQSACGEGSPERRVGTPYVQGMTVADTGWFKEMRS